MKEYAALFIQVVFGIDTAVVMFGSIMTSEKKRTDIIKLILGTLAGLIIFAAALKESGFDLTKMDSLIESLGFLAGFWAGYLCLWRTLSLHNQEPTETTVIIVVSLLLAYFASRFIV